MVRGSLACVLTALAFLFLTAQADVSAQTQTKRVFEVLENGRTSAAVTLQRTADAVTISINRANKPAHVYRSFPLASAFSLHIGKKRALTYNSELRTVTVGASNFGLDKVNTMAVGYGRDDVAALRRRVADDMRVLRAVREREPSVRLFETALVITTGDDSVLQGEAPPSLSVVLPGAAAGGPLRRDRRRSARAIRSRPDRRRLTL